MWPRKIPILPSLLTEVGDEGTPPADSQSPFLWKQQVYSVIGLYSLNGNDKEADVLSGISALLSLKKVSALLEISTGK